jgi:cation transport regulator ChaC
MRYFAYGSNMDLVQMQDRCPTARPLGSALLAHHRFQIDSRGFATVTPWAGSSVHGIAWEISETDEASLDQYEEVPDLYVKQYRSVQFNGRSESMLVYISTDHSSRSGPSEYLERIIDVAEESHLPTDYVRELRSWTGD